MPSSVCPAVDAATCTDDDFGCAISACDVVAATGCSMSTTDALGASSSICLAVEAATRVDDGSGYSDFACDIVATPGSAMWQNRLI